MEWTTNGIDAPYNDRYVNGDFGHAVAIPNAEIGPKVVEWFSDTLEMAVEMWLCEVSA